MAARSASSARSSGSRTGAPLASKPRTNLPTFRSFVASRRPIFIWPVSKAVSVPGLPLAAQCRTASEPCVRSRSSGVTALPFDFDIFLRSGSRIHPEIAVCRQGSVSCPVWARRTVANSQVRMISWACGRRSIGKRRANRSGSASCRPAICGVSEEVAQVSMTSGSPVKPCGLSRWEGS
ncbi:hypothetical protein SMD44_07210 [Streptomyces alboflavus]|uniref:Uncharacterized protein n=1 Tax=Streptomyces alboflavus TaxID=67267 RepID=A0A1Z1WMV2_9ACTN|nr:hypothetical protein SMD44_07210 [Streptomyces alboflavus]